MMSQREHGLEPAGEEVGRSGQAEACASRRAGEATQEGSRRRSSASGSTARRFRSAAVSFTQKSGFFIWGTRKPLGQNKACNGNRWKHREGKEPLK